MEDYPLYTESAFSVTPSGTRVTLVPGETYHGAIILSNPVDAENELHYKVYAVPYSEIVGDGNVGLSDYSGITEWVKIEESDGVVLQNEDKTIHYSINVPIDATGGGQYFALLVQNTVETKDSNEAIDIKDSIELSSIVFAQVDGDIIYDGSITDTNIPAFAFKNPVSVEIGLSNTGNIHQDAAVNITVKEHFSGNQVDVRENSESTEGVVNDDGVINTSYVVLPGNSRYVNIQVAGLSDIGVYDFHETINFNNTDYTTDQTVIICPLWLIGIALFAFLMLIASIIIAIRKIIKGRKKRTTE